MVSTPSFLSFPQRLGVPASQWNKLKWQLLCELRVAVPGIISSFDAAKQTATVQVAIQENINNPKTLVPAPTTIPILSDVPVIMPRSGGFAVTLPVNEGDECLLVFGDNDYGGWFQSGGVQAQVFRRRHNLSDSFAIVGLWSQPNVLEDFSTDSLQVRSDDGTQVIDVKAGEIDVTSNAKVKLIVGSQTIEANAMDININSNGKVNINAASSVVIQGKDFMAHEHSGVQTGTGNSGPVVP